MAQDIRVKIGMTLGVLTEMIGAHELLAANGTTEVLFARVRSDMSGQFVRSGKSLATSGPMAWERSFACMSPLVSFEMRRLSVNF